MASLGTLSPCCPSAWFVPWSTATFHSRWWRLRRRTKCKAAQCQISCAITKRRLAASRPFMHSALKSMLSTSVPAVGRRPYIPGTSSSRMVCSVVNGNIPQPVVAIAAAYKMQGGTVPDLMRHYKTAGCGIQALHEQGIEKHALAVGGCGRQASIHNRNQLQAHGQRTQKGLRQQQLYAVSFKHGHDVRLGFFLLLVKGSCSRLM